MKQSENVPICVKHANHCKVFYWLKCKYMDAYRGLWKNMQLGDNDACPGEEGSLEVLLVET